MRYRSTSREAPLTSLRGAVLRGLAPDGGLYMPVEIARRSPEELEEFRRCRSRKFAFASCDRLQGPEVPEEVLWQVVSEAINFPVKLVSLSPGLHILELFHGPTLAFKDFGARFMARLMGYFVRDETRPLTVLVATSGDTGSAVAHGFLGVPGIRVVILYPSKRISEAQEKQFTTLGENITALEVAGTFDDCQRLGEAGIHGCGAEQARVSDFGEFDQYRATVAADVLSRRGVPAIAGCVGAADRFGAQRKFRKFDGGNFCQAHRIAGDEICGIDECERCGAGIFAHGRISTASSACRRMSNAMDVGNPNNFPRLLDLCRGRLEYVQKEIWGHGATDAETLAAMKSYTSDIGTSLIPHTAVGDSRLGSVHAKRTGAGARTGAGHRTSRKIRRNGQTCDRDCAAIAGPAGVVSEKRKTVAADGQHLRRVQRIPAVELMTTITCQLNWTRYKGVMVKFSAAGATLWIL